jgi:hypothetical protein
VAVSLLRHSTCGNDLNKPYDPNPLLPATAVSREGFASLGVGGISCRSYGAFKFAPSAPLHRHSFEPHSKYWRIDLECCTMDFKAKIESAEDAKSSSLVSGRERLTYLLWRAALAVLVADPLTSI